MPFFHRSGLWSPPHVRPSTMELDHEASQMKDYNAHVTAAATWHMCSVMACLSTVRQLIRSSHHPWGRGFKVSRLTEAGVEKSEPTSPVRLNGPSR
ncbi:hypothetical protein OPV22_031458 [Ensete ventricosum]|uniref:Uncharacterized protein n=1 Tax=Ensete ventricosum TaxID=4639 RepID=A0AAV8PTM5_ENSVE|nr:hypothetical protein OPV22_031458 [Ensete ventricosum]